MSDTPDHHRRNVDDSAEHRREWSADTPASIAVVEAVASVAGRDPTELPPLHESIDPDALDALFRRSDQRDSPDVVSFPFDEYVVVVRGSGEIAVYPRQSDAVD